MLYISSSWIKSDNYVEEFKKIASFCKNIELSGGLKFYSKLADDITIVQKELGLNFLIHGFFPPSENKNFLLNLSDSSKETYEFITNSMEYVNKFNIPYYSLHAGLKQSFEVDNEILLNPSGNFDFNDMIENIKWFYDTFPSKKLAVENMYPINRNIDCAYCMHPEDIIKLLESDERVLLLLDLGHLKVSSKYLNFDFIENAQRLLDRFKNRIAEIHLSENSGHDDEHLCIQKNSKQLLFIKKNIKLLYQHKINLVIESRNSSFGELKKTYCYFKKLYPQG